MEISNWNLNGMMMFAGRYASVKNDSAKLGVCSLLSQPQSLPVVMQLPERGAYWGKPHSALSPYMEGKQARPRRAAVRLWQTSIAAVELTTGCSF